MNTRSSARSLIRTKRIKPRESLAFGGSYSPPLSRGGRGHEARRRRGQCVHRSTCQRTSRWRLDESGALPDLNGEIVLEIRDPEVKKFEYEERTGRVLGLRALLDEIILGPARLVRNCLTKSTYIGPLREIPSRSYRPQVSPDDARWANGLAAWDLLNADRAGRLINDVNAWLVGKKKLNTGYQVERVEYREVPVPSRLNQLFERGVTEDDLPELEELYRGLQVERRLRSAIPKEESS